MIKRHCPIVFKTTEPGFHFFGYYDKSPLDRPADRLLVHRAHFNAYRMPREEDEIEIGFFTLKNSSYQKLCTTRAYNWQQGSQLQWMPPDYQSRIIFNDREKAWLDVWMFKIHEAPQTTAIFKVLRLFKS